MGKKRESKPRSRKEKREAERKKSGIEFFLEYTRIFGLIARPKKNVPKGKLVLYQIFPLLVNIFVFIMAYFMYCGVTSEENPSIIMLIVTYIVLFIAIISIIRAFVAMYAIGFRDYDGL